MWLGERRRPLPDAESKSAALLSPQLSIMLKLQENIASTTPISCRIRYKSVPRVIKDLQGVSAAQRDRTRHEIAFCSVVDFTSHALPSPLLTALVPSRKATPVSPCSTPTGIGNLRHPFKYKSVRNALYDFAVGIDARRQPRQYEAVIIESLSFHFITYRATFVIEYVCATFDLPSFLCTKEQHRSSANTNRYYFIARLQIANLQTAIPLLKRHHRSITLRAPASNIPRIQVASA